jgi:hypothetical protein
MGRANKRFALKNSKLRKNRRAAVAALLLPENDGAPRRVRVVA